ncbi:hypothetical protein [Nocardioides sp. YIM 152588]|uniref:hypothetical protein n=1 Tax=Nocardioides sp. YIM 152588 TaxID=3158259 RepID=UPI0032E37FA9
MSSQEPEPAWKRKQRLAEIFGDALPDTTSDERDEGARPSGGGKGESASDRWLKSQVPPHHGG